MPFAIRDAAPEDFGLILPLLRGLHALHADARPDVMGPPDDAALLADLRALRQEEGATALLALAADGTALGYAVFAIEERPARPLYRARRWGVLHHIAVAEGHRRQGVGRALVEALRDRLRAAGVTRMRTSYWAFNAPSAALMRRAGFVPYLIQAEAEV